MQSIFNGTQQNQFHMLQQFAQFKKSIQGRDPNIILQELLKSGKYTQADVDRAREMATAFQSILH